MAVLLLVAWLWLSRTTSGRAWLASALAAQANGLLDGRGSIRIGRLEAIGPRRMVLREVTLLDTAGASVVSVASAQVTIDLPGILDRAIHLPMLELEGVRIALRQDAIGKPWNLAFVLFGDQPAAPPGRPGFGDDVRIDRLRVQAVSMTTRMPWAPHPIFTGTARDSVIVVRDSLHDLERASGGRFFERRHIRIAHAVAHTVVLADTLRQPASLQLDSLIGSISDPPVEIRQAAGHIRWTSDSLQLDLAEVVLPDSRGRARGAVSWNQPGPVHFDVRVDADAALADLRWVWDVMPPAGRLRAAIRMRTLADADDAEYRLQDLRVESGRSRIEGEVAVIVRPAELRLQEVDLRFVPLEAALARRLSYEALPPTMQGLLEGRLVARAGGPLTAFTIDRLDVGYRDEVQGRPVWSRLQLRGVVGMEERPFVRNLEVRALQLDWPQLRRLAGLSGRTTPWPDGTLDGRLSVRYADPMSVDLASLDLGWKDAVGHASRVNGTLRAVVGRTPWSMRASLAVTPLSMAAVARMDSVVPPLRDLHGSLEVDGTRDALTWRVMLQPGGARSAGAAASQLVVGGRALERDGRWSLDADGALNGLDLRDWVEADDVPPTAITGTVRLAAEAIPIGASSASAGPPRQARVHWQLRQTGADDRPAFGTHGRGALLAERFVIDSMTVDVTGAVLTAAGALARSGRRDDTLQVSLRIDSLAALRTDLARVARMMAVRDSGVAATLMTLASDTLRGDASLSGYVYGSLDTLAATVAFGARDVHVGTRHVDRLLGSLELTRADTTLAFRGAASADAVRGLGVVTLQSASLEVSDGTADAGRLQLTLRTNDEAVLATRARYRLGTAQREFAVEAMDLTYDGNAWRMTDALRVTDDSLGLKVAPFELRSTGGGLVRGGGALPRRGAITGQLELERFPIGEFAALLAGTPTIPGLLSGRADLSGTRAAPEWRGTLIADSLRTRTVRFPRVEASGTYRDRRASLRAGLRDSTGGRVEAELAVPIDLAFDVTGPRILDDSVRGRLQIDALRLEMLPVAVDGVSQLRGTVAGEVLIGGTFDDPRLTGELAVTDAGAVIPGLGIAPRDGRMLLRADADSIRLVTLAIRSGGPGDTLSASGVLHLPRGPSTARTTADLDVQVMARNVVATRQRDGTDLDLSGMIRLRGSLDRPVLSGTLRVPAANIVVDPLGARTALDLSTEAARALLGAAEVPIAATVTPSLAVLGRFIAVENARIDLGNAVWVQTPEAKVKLGGGLEVAVRGDALTLDGEILATRGQYRLDLGVVNRSFAIDSGRVRFFGQAALAPSLDISATHIVRVAGGSEVPVQVHIGGTYDRPVLSLSSRDPLYASAPESEIISLLLFGAPTFALDGQSQSTVRAVTGVLLPSVGGVVEGALQRLLPVFNTFQVTTAGGQSTGQLSALSLLDNLSIAAGKQVGDRTFLRLNTGVCRTANAAATRSASLWYGAAAEYRLGPLWSVQVGVDPGASPCARLGPDVLPRMQFGFDLFREWIW